MSNQIIAAQEENADEEEVTAMIQAGVTYQADASDYNDVAPIEAYLTPEAHEIQATEICVVPTKAEEAQEARAKVKRYSIIGCISVILLVIIIMVPLALTVLRKKDVQEKFVYVTLHPTISPTRYPTIDPTSSPTDFLYTEYIDFFSNLSDLDELTTRGTPQNNALRWIYYYDPGGRRELSHPKLTQRYIAAVFYYSTSGGRGWADCYPGDELCTSDSKQSWFGAEDECEWYGFARCNIDGFVTAFVIVNNQNREGNRINGNNLHGFLPPEMGYLQSLEHLTIARNPMLTSTIPSTFSRLTNLVSCNLILNGLEGPLNDELFVNMTSIKEIYLNYNAFNRQLPKSLANRTSLAGLGLAGNLFEGEIPKQYGQLHQLRKLELNDNLLTGSLPTELGQLSSLQFLKLDNNFMNGTLAEDVFRNMTKLYSLDLSNNEFHGKIPSSLGLVGSKMERRKNVNLSGNRLSGNIPGTLGDILYLHSLSLHDNDLVGSMPSSICDIRGEGYISLQYLTVDCELVVCKCCFPNCHV